MHIAWAYPLVFWAHISLVAASVSLFTLRGIGVLAGHAWPMLKGWRGLSVVLDSALLMAGATLWWLLQLNPAHDTWLAAKLCLLVAYIVLGSFALKRASTAWGRAMCFLAALACVSLMASIAVLHHPLGWLSRLCMGCL